ncbi:hypothetical protein [Nocardioides koreensis]|uniref:hypothetical protein n=1 Tax=Nocardioides koreensis TaxID=433651 RepID=UPI0031E1CFFE
MNEVSVVVVDGIGGLSGVGAGIADFRAWIVAGVVLIALAALAWWTMKPAGRVDRDRQEAGRSARTPKRRS